VAREMVFNWTQENVELLVGWWTEGRTSGEIAQAFGTTRNAVIGKLWRLRLFGADRDAPPISPAPPKRPRLARTPAASKPSSKPRMPICEKVSPHSVSLALAEPRNCRWPIGDPWHDDFRFCGAVKIRGPYCAEHAAIVYQPRPVNAARARLLRGRSNTTCG